MAELKTKQNDASVEDFINAVESEQKRKDAYTILELMKTITGEPAKMWGPSIIGFGKVPLKYASGRELEWPICGFSPRKASISLYVSCNISTQQDLLNKLGKHKTGKGCLYINKLTDVNMDVLNELIKTSLK